MKLLMENWRRYLDEEEDAPPQPQKCVTVGSVLQSVDALQRGEKKAKIARAVGTGAAHTAAFVLSHLPGVGPSLAKGIKGAMGAKMALKAAKDFMARRGGKIPFDTVKKFPILGHLKVDPELVKVVEDDVLRQIDELYENEVLTKVSPTTCVEDIPNINEFIRSKISSLTDKHVVIDDESGGS